MSVAAIVASRGMVLGDAKIECAFLDFSDTGTASVKSGTTNPSTAVTDWKLGSLARDSDSEHSDDDNDEFFDCQGEFKFARSPLQMETLPVLMNSHL